MPVTLGIAQAGIGLGQSIIGGIRAHKAQKALENLNTPAYGGSKSINDYYKQALSRYQTSPYASQQYQYASNAAQRSTAAGLGALQDRHSAIGGVSRLVAGQNDALLKAGMLAEQNQNQRFSQLGGATSMKNQDDMYGFQINKLMPYQKQFQLLGLQASGGNKIESAGMQNIWGGLQLGAMGAGNIFGGAGQTQSAMQQQQFRVGAGPAWMKNYQDPGLLPPSGGY